MSMKRFFALLVLCLLVLTILPIVCLNVQSDPFGTNKAVLMANFKQYQPECTVTGSGGTASIYSVWTDNQWGVTNGDITFSRSTNGGTTFSIPMRINNGDAASNTSSEDSPDIAVSGTYVYIVWKDMSQGQTHLYFRKSSTSGASFDPDVSIVAATSSDPTPRISASGNNVYVTYKGKNDEGIWCMMSSNNGVSFGAPANVQGAPDQRIAKKPDIAVDSTNVYVAFDYEDIEYGKRDIWVSKSSLSSLSFGAAVDVTTQSTSDQVGPTIEASDDGVFVAWMDYRNDPDKEWTGDSTDDCDIYSTKSANQGSSFSAAARVNDDPMSNLNQQEDPSIDVDGTGKAMVTWTDKRNTDRDIYFSMDTGSGFGKNGRVNEFQATPADQLQSSISIDDANVPHVIWSDTRNEQGDIYYSHTIPNTPPTTPVMTDPDQVQETSMRIKWQGNIESDFSLYELHMSPTPGITPGPTTLNATIFDQATTSYIINELEPGTKYYFKLVVTDFDEASSTSNEVSAITFNVNQGPNWLKQVDDLSFEEDNHTQGTHILNLSDGYFWDDYYGGFAPRLQVNTTPENQASNNIFGVVEKIGTYFYLTFKPQSNFAGTETFWIFLSDNGTDGSPDNADDKGAEGETFTVTTTDINDPPTFDKIGSGILWDKKITTFATLDLTGTIEKGRQGQLYEFTISATDIGGQHHNHEDGCPDGQS